MADLKAQAFIRSWPGDHSLRPGSVWSHVLLVDFVDLSQIQRLPDLLVLFQKPNEKSLVPDAEETFKTPAELRVDLSTQPSPWQLDSKVARQLVSSLYSTEDSVSLVADIGQSEQVLLAMIEQQWPRLRRTFSFRTRSRSSANPSFRFDIEVVERARTVPSRVIEDANWIDVLLRDLQKPDRSFRDLLRTFGAESTSGRVDMAGLVSVIDAAQHGGSAPSVLDQVCVAFPAPHAMASLKKVLFGSQDDTPPQLTNWPTDDLVRLALLFETARPCLDLKDLDLNRRLRKAWHSRPSEVINLIARAQVEDLSDDQLGAVVSATASEASPAQVADLATQSIDLALLVARANPAVVETAELWSVETIGPALLDILGSLDRRAQTQTLVALMDSGQDDAAASVCSLDSTLWWDAFGHLAVVESKDPLRHLFNRASSLRRVLERVGPAAVGEPHGVPSGENQLVLLAFAADPSAGIWRRAPSEAWVALVEHPPKASRSEEGEIAMFRLCALALSAAIQSGSSDLRRRAWLASFGTLHHGLESVQANDEAWNVLQAVLPREPEWDRCGRLRKAAVETVVRDRWPQEDIEELLRAVPEYGPDLAQALRAREERKKRSRGWLLDFIDDLLP